MDPRTSKTLTVGERVVFDGDAFGRVEATNRHTVVIAWDDGESSEIAHFDADLLERATPLSQTDDR